jgi:hypothetical protein|tara:strand:- start:425 stop:2803 length:2379 start_codon:yes stop_codon:yes gene_type:complete
MLIRQRFILTIAVIFSFLWISSTLVASETRGIKIKLRTKESTGAPVAEEVNLYGSSYALVVGIDNYTQGWPRLSGAVRDAKLVAEELRRKGFEVTLETNLKSNELEQVFKEFFIIKGDNTQARLFVWFAGHGHTLDGEGFLVPADAPRADKGAQFRLKALSMRRFGEYVRLAQSKHAFAVFDSCFSGTIFTTQRSSPPIAVTRATTLPARQFLSSGDAQQQVSDDGMFRKLFVRAIRGEERADANGDGYLTGSELGLFLTDRMTNLTRSAQTPRYGKLRDPDYDRGDFVFLLASSGAVIDEPATKPSKAYLSVESNISGARVFVDGQKEGTTPLSDVLLSAGEHLILVKKQGYETYQKRVRFQKGRSMSLYVDLSLEAPKRGRIYVDTQPEDTRIKILNIGPAFYQGIKLETGRYHVEVSADGYETKKLWVTLAAGEDKTLDIRLKRVAVSSHAGWSVRSVDSQGNVGIMSSIVIDRHGHPHMSYWDTTVDGYKNARLKYARWNGSDFDIQYVDGKGMGRYNSLALDPEGNPHICYHYYQGDSLRYARWTGSEWRTETVDSAGYVGRHCSLAVDGQGVPHISYQLKSNSYRIKYATKYGGSWKTAEVARAGSEGYVGWDTAIALDKDGRPHIAYYDDSSTQVMHAFMEAGRWRRRAVDRAQKWAGGEALDIAVDSLGRPHIAYYDAEPKKDMKYAVWTGSDWSIDTVVSAGDVGRSPSIALDASDRPHISYDDRSSKALKYAFQTASGGWSISTVAPYYGKWTLAALMLDLEGNPHISFYDEKMGDFLYACP